MTLAWTTLQPAHSVVRRTAELVALVVISSLMSSPHHTGLPCSILLANIHFEITERGMRMNVGFIGLGNMGSGMARNLIKAGHSLTVYNRTRSRAEELRPLGATVVTTPAEAASGVQVLITMLADDDAVENSLFGPGRALQSLPAGSVHISMSTISVSLSRKLVGAHREKQQHYVAAPVFGRPDAAAAAKLFIVAAGPTNQIERCQVLFDVMGQKTFVVNQDPPSANVVKLTGNFLITT